MKTLLVVLPVIAATFVGCSSSPKKNVDVFAMDPTFERNKGSFSNRGPTSNQDSWMPSEEDFDEISKYSQKEGFVGYDVIACYVQGKLKLGGVSHWGVGYTLFMDYRNKRVNIGSFKQSRESKGETVQYVGDQLIFEITFKGSKKDTSTMEATIKNTQGQTSGTLNCYQRNSGLE